MSTVQFKPRSVVSDGQMSWRDQAGVSTSTAMRRAVQDVSDATWITNDNVSVVGGYNFLWYQLGLATTLTIASTTAAATITVASTEAFPAAGSGTLSTAAITWTGKTATTLTGCTGVIVAGIGTEVVLTSTAALDLPASVQVRSVRPWARGNLVSGTNQLMSAVLDGAGNKSGESYWTPTTSIANKGGTVYTADPLGGSWTPTALLGLGQSLRCGSPFLTHRVHHMWADVVLNYAPAATPSMVNLGLTSQPTVSWVYSDPEGDVQAGWRVKVFTAAQYGAGGFNPETSTATASAWVFSAATSWQVSAALPDGTYRAYVTVTDSGSYGRYGAWSYVQFVQAVVVPVAPTMTATADPTNARVTLTIPGRADMTVTLTAQRSADAGVTWVDVYGAVGMPTLTTGQTLTFYDYAAPPNTSVVYRSTATTVTSGFTLTSLPSASTAGVTVASTVWRLKDPDAPADNIVVSVFGGDGALSKEIEESQGVFAALGREFPIVLSGGLKAPRVQQITFQTFSEAEWVALKKLRDKCKTLLLQDDLAGSAHIRLGPQFNPAIQQTAARRTAPLRRVQTSYLEVAAPVSP